MTDPPGLGRPDRTEKGRPVRAPMKVVPVRHPGRWVSAAVILVLMAMLFNSLVFSKVVRGNQTEGRFQWGEVGKYLFAAPDLAAVSGSPWS